MKRIVTLLCIVAVCCMFYKMFFAGVRKAGTETCLVLIDLVNDGNGVYRLVVPVQLSDTY